ncbi:hypothetical protein HH310_22120 [Actinoplanes sp. TBRC 11911]|uniref:hypothetical protein n=1 Tax=Actinoplanes sp. TBRC 11911 TaxID=2729386 RepID=UPI00145EF5AF|nr:hypothetical protein [Actinoplanes sp. TBRC 11911]NMO53866.1 hypothetical protein [Actinoplanes sp. TBRC 11911]
MASDRVAVPSRTESPGWVEVVLRVLGTGLLGLWWSRPSAMRYRRRRRSECAGCAHRYHRVMRVLIVLVWLQMVGIVALLAYGARPPTCQPPSLSSYNGATRYVTPTHDWVIPVRQVITAGNSGLALAYGKALGGQFCDYVPNGTLLGRMKDGFARGGTTYGHTYLTSLEPQLVYSDMAPVMRHESRHTDQWALFTLLGGPVAFPLAYGVDDVFAPGPYNNFERDAGLADGGYVLPDTPSPTTTRLIVAGALFAIFFFERHRVRRQVRLAKLLVHRLRIAEPPWWYAHTEPVTPGPAIGVVRRVSPAVADAMTEHRRLQQLGCPDCGAIGY